MFLNIYKIAGVIYIRNNNMFWLLKSFPHDTSDKFQARMPISSPHTCAWTIAFIIYEWVSSSDMFILSTISASCASFFKTNLFNWSHHTQTIIHRIDAHISHLGNIYPAWESALRDDSPHETGDRYLLAKNELALTYNSKLDEDARTQYYFPEACKCA